LNARQRLRQQFGEIRAQDVDQHPLTDRFGFDGFVRAVVLVAPVALDDDGKIVGGDLLLGQRDALPVQRPAYLTLRTRRVLSSMWPPDRSRSPR
jgi:hypothetical protein